MRWVVWMLGLCLWAQDGQHRNQPGWPCVAGRAVDPSYLQLSESTGGQLFLFQKGEMQHSSVVMSAPSSHPVTIFRAVGQLSGTREFEFPVDSTVETMLVMASMQCRQSVALIEPAGSEIAPSRANLNVDLQAGRIVQVDTPSFGMWKVRLAGSGLFVFTVQVKSKIRIAVTERESQYQISATNFSGPTQIWELSATGEKSAGAQRYRIAVEGRDERGWPALRMHPVLFGRKANQSFTIAASVRAVVQW